MKKKESDGHSDNDNLKKLSSLRNSSGENRKPGSRRGYPTVVGIGASAGGLEAIQAFFTAMPVDSGMAFVVIPTLIA